MLLEESKRRQELLKQYIWELAAQCFESEKIREYAFKLKDLYKNDKDEFTKYTKVIYYEARLIEGLPIDNPTELSNLMCDIMANK